MVGGVCKQGKVAVEGSSSSVCVTAVELEYAISTTEDRSAIGNLAGENRLGDRGGWRMWRNEQCQSLHGWHYGVDNEEPLQSRVEHIEVVQKQLFYC